MDNLAPFLVESVLMTFGALILESFSLRQVIHNVLSHERWRFLTASHYLTQVACLLFVIQCIDSQSGLGLYSQSAVMFLGDVKGFIIIASARALAAGFVDSHKLMTKGPQGPPLGLILLVVHGIFMLFGITFFLVLLITRDSWCAVAARVLFSAYSLIVGAQVISSAWKVRSILIEENGRTGKYADGIRKLTRLIVLIIVILILGNAAIMIGLANDVDFAKRQSLLFEGQRPFQLMHIFSDFIGLLSIFALLMGAWSTSQKVVSLSRKSTMHSTEISRRLERGNTRDTGSGVRADSTGSTNSTEIAIEMAGTEECASA
jgi:hypothetical protein